MGIRGLLGLLFWISAGIQPAPVGARDVDSTAPVTTRSIDELRRRAEAGDGPAQYELGRRHAEGSGVPVDKALSLRLYPAAAARSLPEAEYELAKHYSGLAGDRLDVSQAVDYMERAARHGHAAAQADLAFLYFNGSPTLPKNLPLSFTWFRRAADGGSVIAQCMLGDFYKDGLGGAKQDAAEAFKWYRRTAVQNDRCAPKSQFELYVAYESGRGVAKDSNAAIDWLKKAAQAGNPRAQATLGRAYQHGRGVPRNAELAEMWLKKSREGVSAHDDHDEHDRH